MARPVRLGERASLADLPSVARRPIMRSSTPGRIAAHLLLVSALSGAIALAGCSQKMTANDNTSSIAKSSIDAATRATQPNAVELTNQALVYECPKCGTDYDKAGKCPTDGADLVATQVSYICPADHLPADHAGKCPRCNMDVQ